MKSIQMNEWTLVTRKKTRTKSSIQEIFSDNGILNDKLDSVFKERYTLKLLYNTIEYKQVNDHNKADLVAYFRDKLTDINNFKKIICANPDVDLSKIKLMQIIDGIKVNKDINKCYVILVCETDNALLPYCVISYKLNLFYLDTNEYCIFLRNWMEVILYMFKFETDIKNDTVNSMIVDYPISFHHDKIDILDYFNQFHRVWRNCVKID